MKRIRDVHLRHDLVAQLDEIVGHFLGFNFGETEMRLRVDQPRINSHPGHIDHLRASRNFYLARFSDSGDLAAFHHQHAVFDRAMRDGQQLAARERDGLTRSLVSSLIAMRVYGFARLRDAQRRTEKNSSDQSSQHYWPSFTTGISGATSATLP